MNDESPKPDFKIEFQGFDDENRALHECMRCGASVSASSEFRRVCGAGLSGGSMGGLESGGFPNLDYCDIIVKVIS